MRLPDLNQEAIKIDPLSISCGLLEGLYIVGESQVVRNADRDSLKFSVFGRDGFECRSDPFDTQQFRPKNRIPKFRCLRKVDYS